MESLASSGSVPIWKLYGTNLPTSLVIFLDLSLSVFHVFQEANNEVGAAGPSGDFEIRDDRRNDIGRDIMPVEPDLVGNTVEGGSSAAQLPQKNILERKEVLIGRYLAERLMITLSLYVFVTSKCLSCTCSCESVTQPPLR